MKDRSVSVQNKRSIKVIPCLLLAAFATCLAAGCSAGPVDGPQPSEEPTAQTGQSSQELRSQEFDYEYYSDATYTKMVGYWFGDCYGASGRWGKITKFVIGSRTACTSHISVDCYEYIEGTDYCPSVSCVYCQ
jgi:hypothetical protein